MSLHLHFNCELFKNTLHILCHLSTQPSGAKQAPVTQTDVIHTGKRRLGDGGGAEHETRRMRKGKDWEEKGRERPLSFHYFDFPFFFF